MKCEIIFKGASYEQRMIEAYLPEYKHSQFAIPSPIGDKHNLFGYVSDEFWRAHPELNIEIKTILKQVVYKHLWFMMGWDLAENDNWHTFECWKFWLDEWIKNYEYFKPNEEEYKMCLNSFYNKYERSKGSRKFNFLGNEIL